MKELLIFIAGAIAGALVLVLWACCVKCKQADGSIDMYWEVKNGKNDGSDG